MKTWVRKSLSVGVLAAGAVLFSQGSALAGPSGAATSTTEPTSQLPSSTATPPQVDTRP